MLMNKFEFISMNNPIRGFIQERIELKNILSLVQLEKGKTVLEIGCGNGHGTKLIKKYFNPEKIVAIDLDPNMIKIAKRSNKDSSVLFSVGDAANLPTIPDNSFDAIFDFGIIHHIPNWEDCLNELKRLLKPGGLLILEDLSIETFSTTFGRMIRQVLDHPYNEMFTKKEFIEYLEKLGFKVINSKVHFPLSTIQYFIVVARK
jgi:ubiquinone/menaquinone biosynthesis C-methylase UbiE